MNQAKTITRIPLADLYESPFNHRQRFDEAYLQELATDFKSQGILQPLLVRPRVPPLFAHEGEAAAVGYELVFGHCRLRAAHLAEMPDAPCMVCAMTDVEVKLAQISENLQRKDVHPIEEAQGYQALIDDHGYTADTIAEKFGKSRTVVYGRLKLLQACPEIRNACLAGEIGNEVALLIARLGSEKIQSKALGYIKSGHLSLTEGGKESYRRVKDMLNERFTLDLKDAPFPIDDAGLVASAGTCNDCPRRSGNAPEYADIADAEKTSRWSRLNTGADVCTDPDCHQAKKVAFFKRKADALRADGKIVVDGNKARAAIGADGTIKGAYVALKGVKSKVSEARCVAQGNSSIAPPLLVTIQDPRTGKEVEAVAIADLVAAGVMEKDKPKGKSNPGRDWEAERRAEEAEQARATEENKRLFEAVREALRGRELGIDIVRMIATELIDLGEADGYGDNTHVDLVCEVWGVPNSSELKELAAVMNGSDLTTLMVHLALAYGVDQRGNNSRDWDKPLNLIKIAELLGIDPEPVATEPKVAVKQPEPAAPVLTPQAAWPFPKRDEPAQVASTPPSAARAQSKAAAKASTVRYRNVATGETWSGRGQQPTWLKVAIAGGAKLEDFENQAGSAGKDDEGAGKAGAETATADSAAAGALETAEEAV